MNLLIDTHILLWSLIDSPRLPLSWKRILENKDNRVLVSVASLWEIQIKHMLYPDSFPSSETIAEFCEKIDYEILPINKSEVFNLKSLKPIHKDPFDRILLSQAKTYGLKFLTQDEAILKYQDSCLKL